MRKALWFLVGFCLVVMACDMFSGADIKSAEEEFKNQYIDLSGDWYFKVYRKYSNMFQYFAYNACTVTWTDDSSAVIPAAAVFKTWDIVQGPSNDYSTGGLLQMTNDGSTTDARNTLLASDVFPKWSESWWCKEITISEGFLAEPTVTLLLSIIDDMDVVYINGTPVAASGFKKADNTQAPASLVPSLGGFDQSGDFRFEKSYWEVSREYTVDSSLLQTGKNEICIRVYNNNSYGGFYDRTMALSATASATRYLKGLPTDSISKSGVLGELVATQITALEQKNIKAYAATLSDLYQNNELDKAKQVAQVSEWFSLYDTIIVEDTNNGFYKLNNKDRCYTAHRVITGRKGAVSEVILDDENYYIYFIFDNYKLKEKGNYNRCYSVTYTSALTEMNGKELVYSVYLPPSYYTDRTARYPVVYLLHGINSTGQSFINVDKIQDKMEAWIKEGKIKEMIVVMPDSGKSSGYENTTTPAGGPSDSAGPWEDHITIDIRGQIESNYRVLQDKKFRALTGISMGGGGAFKIGLKHTDLYSSIASHMGAVGASTNTLIDTVPAATLKTMDFYLDCGLQDTMVSPANTQLVAEYLVSLGIPVTWELRDGGHNSAFYMSSMLNSMSCHSRHFTANGL
ncbi:alpha/beta hydrolase [Breznakiella homolactica]|uniref:Enterochelin esterase n=1 Tax=Breznakiella homolactica TaxID=2798577 RepID=A0A7T7XLL5_9SPIR|nr:alpha/beta hydrolase-fold protein [Breznakiella homolactica]QQO08649.1 hypothetical protein JFL75_17215 [Breznakiella homolactica]